MRKPPKYRVWINEYKIPIEAETDKALQEIKVAFSDEGISKVETQED